MRIHLASLVLPLLLALGCSSADEPAPVIDAAPPSNVPDDPSGTFAVLTALDETGQIAVPSHAIVLRYGALVRAALDTAVVPAASPGAHDMTEALSALLDCAALGNTIAQKLGIGSPLLYRGACITAMTGVAD